MRSLERTHARLSGWLLSNRVYAWIVTVLVLFLATLAVPLSMVDEADPAPIWVPILGVVFMLYGALTAVLWPRILRRPPHEVLGLSWTSAMAPLLVGLVLTVFGAGRWLPGLGWLLVIGSITVAMRRARQSVTILDRPSD